MRLVISKLKKSILRFFQGFSLRKEIISPSFVGIIILLASGYYGSNLTCDSKKMEQERKEDRAYNILVPDTSKSIRNFIKNDSIQSIDRAQPLSKESRNRDSSQSNKNEQKSNNKDSTLGVNSTKNNFELQTKSIDVGLTPIQIILSVIAGVITFILGQILIKFFIEPAAELRRYIGTIAYDLSYYANLYSNAQIIDNQEKEEVSNILRKDAIKLREYHKVIPMYRLISIAFKLPKINNLLEASKSLVGLSNLVNNKSELKYIYDELRVRKISSALNIRIEQNLSDKEIF